MERQSQMGVVVLGCSSTIELVTPVQDSKLSVWPTPQGMRGWVQRQLKREWLKFSLAGLWLGFVALHIATDSRPVRLLDGRLQTLFFEIRGPVPAPEDIVILAIDDETLSQAEHYQQDPAQYSDLAPIATTPWPRQTYALAIERLLDAGAKAVAVDVLFTTPSSYGAADDAAFEDVLRRYGDRVVLASIFGDDGLHQGAMIRPTLPMDNFLSTPVQTGTINFAIEPDGRIHRHGRAYLNDLRRNVEDVLSRSELPDDLRQARSFAEATLDAAQVNAAPARGDFLHFYGPHRSFTQVPFWYVLDADPWTRQLDGGRFFEDKIVLIGATADRFQDFHQAPFSETLLHPEAMAGVEILATDIATLRAGVALRRGLYQPWMRAVFVLLTGAGCGILLRRVNRPIARLAWTVATASIWFWLSFGAFVLAGYVLPTGVPILGFGMIGGGFIVADIVTGQLRKQRLRKTLEQYVTSPIVQEIISQQDDLHDLLRLREAEVIGLLLGNRYRIVQLLGSGGFGETYVAEDTQRPGAPTCVVKQLRILSNDPKAHQLGRRFFLREAETLERLGHHDQIPRLLAYFEASHSFYLVEEMVEGHLLKQELSSRKPLPQLYGIDLLRGLLPIVEFVHSQGVIHRDIKPSNVIRRHADDQLVLIDFGAVKQISNTLAAPETHLTTTVGVGTEGYMPSEQAAGMPKINSDLYAIGILVIEALTGIPAYAFKRDAHGNILWRNQVPYLDEGFAAILQKLVEYDFRRRYQSATEVQADLAPIADRLANTEPAYGPVTVAPDANPDHPIDLEAATDETNMLPVNWFAEPTQDQEG
jgi:CHASE2 domain-containing sensor protein